MEIALAFARRGEDRPALIRVSMIESRHQRVRTLLDVARIRSDDGHADAAQDIFPIATEEVFRYYREGASYLAALPLFRQIARQFTLIGMDALVTEWIDTLPSGPAAFACLGVAEGLRLRQDKDAEIYE